MKFKIDGEERELVTVKELAELCGVTPRMVSIWIKNENIPPPEYTGDNRRLLWTPQTARRIMLNFSSRTRTRKQPPKRRRRTLY